MKKIIFVVGARPNFMKVAPIMEALQEHNETTSISKNIKAVLVHTGQHYSKDMSDSFFNELSLPKPDINLGVGSGTHCEQIGRIMVGFEKVLLHEKPDFVLVVGDVNSTLACAIDAKKLGIKLIHVEAGLRSGDMTMSEEVNRILTDSISDLLFTTEKSGNENLELEGISPEKIKFVGNVMIDTLLKYKNKAEKLCTFKKLKIKSKKNKDYAVLTLHRPSNVDSSAILSGIGEAFVTIGKSLPVVFPCHPRTKKKIQEFGLENVFSFENSIFLVNPLSYLDFLNLNLNASMVMTDSGGVQEETTILSIPCLTLRRNTERPVTVAQGSNYLVGNNTSDIVNAFFRVREEKKRYEIPELWDGRAGFRIVSEIVSCL